MSEIINGADQAAVVGMLAKFAADRATSDSVADAKEGKYFKRHRRLTQLLDKTLIIIHVIFDY